MDYRKVFGPMRISSTSAGAPQERKLPPRPGGRIVKSLQIMIVVTEKSGDNARIGARLDQGPTSQIFVTHSTPIASSTDPGNTPALVVGDAGPAIIGEWTQIVLTADSSDANQQWLDIEVYEMRKPF